MFMETVVTGVTGGDICLSYPMASVLAAAIASGFVYLQKTKDAATREQIEWFKEQLARKDKDE